MGCSIGEAHCPTCRHFSDQTCRSPGSAAGPMQIEILGPHCVGSTPCVGFFDPQSRPHSRGEELSKACTEAHPGVGGVARSNLKLPRVRKSELPPGAAHGAKQVSGWPAAHYQSSSNPHGYWVLGGHLAGRALVLTLGPECKCRTRKPLYRFRISTVYLYSTQHP